MKKFIPLLFTILLSVFSSASFAGFTSTNYSTNGTYTVSWSDPALGDPYVYGSSVNCYKLYEQKLNSGQAPVEISLPTWCASSVSISGKPVGEYEYTYKVRRCTSSGCTFFSPIGARLTVAVDPNAQAVVTPTLTANAVGSTPYSTNVNNNGEAVISVPISVPASINNMQPKLSLNFNSAGIAARSEDQTTSGWLSYGWSLSGISTIYRCTLGRVDIQVDADPANPSPGNKIWIRPRLAYNDTDSLCLDGDLLVLISGTHLHVGAKYHTYSESFKEVTINGTDAEPWFSVKRPNGVTAVYGKAINSHVRKSVDSTNTTKTAYFHWSIDSETDSFGNTISYAYLAKDEYFSYQTNKTRTYPYSISYPGAGYGVYFQYYNKPSSSASHAGPIDYGPSAGVDRYIYNYDPANQLANITVIGSQGGDRIYQINGASEQTVDDLKYSGLQVGSIQECFAAKSTCIQPLKFSWVTQTSSWSWFNSHYLESVTDSLGAVTKFVYGKNPRDLSEPVNPLFTEKPFDLPASGSWPISANKPAPTYYVTVPSDSPGTLVTSIERSTPIGTDTLHGTDYRYLSYDGSKTCQAKSTIGLGMLGCDAIRISDRTSGVVSYRQYDITSSYDDYKLSGSHLSNTYTYDGVYGQPGVNLISKTETHNDYITITQANGNKTYLPTVTQISNFAYEQGALVGVTLKNNTYTLTNGLITQLVSKTINGSQIDASLTVPANWWGRSAIYTMTPASTKSTTVTTTVFDNAATATDWRIGMATSKQIDSYNGASSGGYTDLKSQRIEYVYKPATMAVQTETRFPLDTENRLVTDYVYDAKGHQTSITVSGANIDTRTTTFSNFYNDHLYPGTVVNALGHATTSTEFDDRFDQPGVITDANGLTSTQTFDSLGRLIAARDVNGNITTQAFISCASTACDSVVGKFGNVTPVYFKEVDSPVDPKTREYYDSLNRVIRVEQQGFIATDWIRTDVQFDEFGRLYKKSLPYMKGGTAMFTTNTYDLKTGRITNILQADGGSVSTYYDTAIGADGYLQARTTTTQYIKKSDGTSAGSQQKISLVDSAGKLTQITDAAGTAQAVTTSYQYDALGNAVKTTVNGGSDGTTVSTDTYDNAGNRLSLTDPNAGTVSSKYNALGQLRWMQDNKGNVTSYTYDKLGRTLSKTSIDGTSNWTYDPAGAKGFLSSVTNNNGYTQTYVYQDSNRLARLSRIDTTIAVPGLATRTYSQSMTYDVYGRAAKSTSPSGFAYTQKYNAQGYPESRWRNDGLYPLGFVLKMGAFGVEEESLNNIHEGMTYDPSSGRVSTISSWVGSTKLQDLAYKWRSNGSLESRTNNKTGSPITDVFQYDNQERLTSTATIYGVPGAGSGPVRTLNQSYNNLGNLLTNTSSNSSDTQVTGYQYTSGRPHATSGATINGVYNTLNYDANGAIIFYDALGTAQDKYIAYNSANQPTNITLGATLTDPNPLARDEFLYTPDGARYYKKSTYREGSTLRVEQTIYLGNYEATYFDGYSALKMSEKTQVGNTLLHVLKTPYSGATSEAIEVLHHDHLGSVDAVSNWGDSSSVVAMAFEPFGSRRDASTFLNNITSGQLSNILAKKDVLNLQGFTGHESLDRTGLIHMNGRVYDPQLGRFVSPDPIVQAPANSQSWNRYSYVLNNPLSYTDPTGFATECQQVQDGYSYLKGKDGVVAGSYRDSFKTVCRDTVDAGGPLTKLPNADSLSPASNWVNQITGLGYSQQYSSSNESGGGSIATSLARLRSLGDGLTDQYVSSYDSQDINFHDYKIGPTYACSIGQLNCSIENVDGIVGQESVPFMVNPTNDVHTLAFTNPIVHFTPAKYVSINETLKGHWFHPGRVVHVTFESEGNVYFYTRGVGIGKDAAANKAVGYILFGTMHNTVNNRVNTELLGITPVAPGF